MHLKAIALLSKELEKSLLFYIDTRSSFVTWANNDGTLKKYLVLNEYGFKINKKMYELGDEYLIF